MNVVQRLNKEYKKYSEHDVHDSVIEPCRICLEAISGPAYCDGDFYIHKSCAESPGEIQHPLHKHPLRICNISIRARPDEFICDGCRTLSVTYNYCCKKCDVKLDFQCVSKHVEGQGLKERVEKVTDYHQHKLQLLYFPYGVPGEDARSCCCCLKGIRDSAYVCLKCGIFIHESCLDTIPKQVKSSFHPQHSLLPRIVTSKEYTHCQVCLKDVSGIALRCPICKYSFHVSCGKRFTPGLRLQDHEHTLFYFDRWDLLSSDDHCDICHKICQGPIYRCIRLRKIFHVECLVPAVLNHECHHHQLTLTSSVVPKGTASKYRCDVCEEEEDFEHYVYHCEECYFMAHIECLFSKEDNPPLVDSEQQIDEVKEAETEDNQETEESDVEGEESEKSSDEEIDETEIDAEQESDLEDCSLSELYEKMTSIIATIEKLTIKLDLVKEKYAKKWVSSWQPPGSGLKLNVDVVVHIGENSFGTGGVLSDS